MNKKDISKLNSYGIDCEYAIKCFSNKKDLYLKYLKAFSDTQFIDNLEAAVKENNMQKVIDAVSKIEDFTAQLCIKKILILTKDISLAIKENNIEELPLKVKSLRKAFDEVSKNIKEFFAVKQ